VLEVAEVAPVIDQVQFSPVVFRRGLLGTGRQLGDRRVAAIAERLGRTPAQVLVRWSLRRDLVVLPKSTHRERIEQNAQVFDFGLSEEDRGALDGLDRSGGTDRALERPWW
jgi:diketogulonate reductase-like aldo/keto reductase